MSHKVFIEKCFYQILSEFYDAKRHNFGIELHYDIVRNLQKEDSKLIEEEFNNLIKENEILIKEAEVLTQEKLMERSMTYVLTETEKQKEVEVEIALVKGGLESQIPQDF